MFFFSVHDKLKLVQPNVQDDLEAFHTSINQNMFESSILYKDDQLLLQNEKSNFDFLKEYFSYFKAEKSSLIYQEAFNFGLIKYIKNNNIIMID